MTEPEDHTEQDLDYLARMYAPEAGEDPWRIGDGFYEQRKRAVLLGCLPRPRFAQAFEPACANGELSAALAERCEALLCTDIAEAAVRRAGRRLAAADGVRVERMRVPHEWPVDRRFDLVVLSEFGYFLPRHDWQAVAGLVAGSLSEDWTVLVCHWRHPFPERTIATDELHETLAAALPGRASVRVLDDDFRLDVFTAAGPGVAARDGRA